MKQTTDEVIHRMEIELNELTGRIGSLERFLISKDYQETSGQQKVFLAQQHTAMERYKEILLKRLVDLRCQEHLEEAAVREYAAQHKIPKQAPEDESGTPAD